MKRLFSGILICAMMAGLWYGQPLKEVHAGYEEEPVYEEMSRALGDILSEHEIMALLCEEDGCLLQREPSFDSKTCAELRSGHTVFIRGIAADDDGEMWAQVETYVKGELQNGYVPFFCLVSSDEDFLQWRRRYLPQPHTYAMAERDVFYEDIDRFPESYRAALYELKSSHPQWIFVPMDTGLDWREVLAEEMQNNRSLIHKNAPDYMRGECYDDGNWYLATEGALAYYLDPRNGLTENTIFQFELLTYNQTYHTKEAVEAFLNRTFMNSEQNAPGNDMTFADIFWLTGAEQNVSPFHLAARVYQEQQRGTSALISGTYPGFEGYYNYFNINASGTSTQEIIVNGLSYARDKNWNSAYASIQGGSGVISSNYIQKGQDTLYLQKFNVNSDGYYRLYTHQYMQNIVAPSSEGQKMKNMYSEAESLENSFVFKIPVYENMPASPCPMPEENGFTGLVYDEVLGWRYMENGSINFQYTGMALNEYGWWYLRDGELDWNYTGMACNEYGWWYFNNGQLDWNYTGMACNEEGWWYYVDGRRDPGYTGMALNEYGWWYYVDGRLDWNYTGMALNEYGWWYYVDGRLDWNYTGMGYNEYGAWYYVDGRIDYTCSP